MPNSSAKYKQIELSFAPASKTPPLIQILSPGRKSVTDLTDSFEKETFRRITRCNSNLSIPTEQPHQKVNLKRASSLDPKMPGGEKDKIESDGSFPPKWNPEILDVEDKAADKQDSEPSNTALMDMLRGMQKDITETKEMKTELAAFRTETQDSMTTLQSNVQNL